MRKAFTLIELIVVIAIIAILAAIIAPNAFKAIEKAKISRTVSDIKTIQAACQSHYADTGHWPIDNDVTDASGASALRNADILSNVRGLLGWDGPYLENEPPTPWGSAYWLPSWDIAGDGAPFDLSIVITNNRYSDFVGLTNPIPDSVLLRVDEVMDNGHLENGTFQTVPGFGSGEGAWVFYWGS